MWTCYVLEHIERMCYVCCKPAPSMLQPLLKYIVNGCVVSSDIAKFSPNIASLLKFITT